MKPRRYHGLKRPKLRQTWNKYNLYNMARSRPPKIGDGNETFFQQKWRAKGMLRAYHGEHVVERKWERMFSRRLLGVANMDPVYMARNDGSELAAGRGSGRDEPPTHGDPIVPQKTLTPYMQMAFAPMERRLDIAVFRAMFASSARQARQFCVHRKVKVNGKVMPYPSYRLNPGDMFQVDPEMVLLGTGRQKTGEDADAGKRKKKVKSSSSEEAEEAAEPAEEEEQASESAPAANQDPDTTDVADPEKEDLAPTRQHIKGLIERAKEVVEAAELGATRKRKLREFARQARLLLSRSGKQNASAADIANELSGMLSDLKLSSSSSSEAAEVEEKSSKSSREPQMTKEERQILARLIREDEENPRDPSKPYRTPWRPRHYMSPFAFIPRYLEVNPNICAAVYLRHPVARVGNAEVPTPFPTEISQLAFNWYLRRR